LVVCYNAVVKTEYVIGEQGAREDGEKPSRARRC